MPQKDTCEQKVKALEKIYKNKQIEIWLSSAFKTINFGSDS